LYFRDAYFACLLAATVPVKAGLVSR